MPIYEYFCRRCDKTFEELIVRKSDEADLRCPACNSNEITRVMSRTAAAAKTGGGAPGRACGPVG